MDTSIFLIMSGRRDAFPKSLTIPGSLTTFPQDIPVEPLYFNVRISISCNMSYYLSNNVFKNIFFQLRCFLELPFVRFRLLFDSSTTSTTPCKTVAEPERSETAFIFERCTSKMICIKTDVSFADKNTQLLSDHVFV